MAIDYEHFKEYELFPTLFEQIDRAFPDLHFKRVGDRWVSKYHLTGEKDGSNKDITFVYSNSKFCAIEHATGNKGKGLIDLYTSLNGGDFHTSIKALCDLLNLTEPTGDSEEWKAYEKTQNNRSHANEVFKTALHADTPEAKQVVEYLTGRGWTMDEIDRGELGLITTQIRQSLSDGDNYKGVVKAAVSDIVSEDNGKVVVKSKETRDREKATGASTDSTEEKVIGGVGTTHLLTIPFRVGSQIKGFKFRHIGQLKDDTGKDYEKYRNTKGLQKGTYLYGIGIGIKDLVLVEGELDALHAKVKGIGNVAATTGGKATEKQIQDAVRRGVDKFTLLFDSDKQGKEYARNTIEAIHPTGASIFVAILPDGVKDLDEYLSNHTKDDFDNEVLGQAQAYSTYLFNDIVMKYVKREEEKGTIYEKDREEFFDEIARLMNSPYIKPYEREGIYSLMERVEDALKFKVDDFREWADKAYLRQQDVKRTKEIKDSAERISAALATGNTDEAIKIMGETSTKVSAQAKETEYAKVFAPSTPTDMANYLSQIQEGIPTGYLFEQGKQSEPLTLNTGLTFICAYRGHGKTSFLNNIAINEARRNVELQNGKSVLYFSYEVDKRRLIIDLLNTFVNDPDMSRSPSNTIQAYFKGNKGYFRNDRRMDGQTHLQYFEKKKNQFLKDYLSSGALTIVEENYKVEELLKAIKWYVATRQVSIICIDYAQLIYSEEWSRQRTEEIKKVVNDIKDFANKEGIPFVIAAQTNRQILSPVSVDTRNIGEGGDFERIADTCIGLFNLKELKPLPTAKEEEKEAKKLLQELGVATYGQGESLKPIQGKMFVRLMKRRYGYYPLDIILNWEGRTKYIEPNDKDALSTEPKQGDIFK